jgi:plastocyanin
MATTCCASHTGSASEARPAGLGSPRGAARRRQRQTTPHRLPALAPLALVCSVALAGLLGASAATAAGGSLRIELRDSTGAPLQDAVVTARGPSPKASAQRAVIDQVDKEFVPFVSVVTVGTAVSFPNQDAIRHHVYSFSPAKQFELPLYKGTPAAPVVFDRPGVVTLGCNIHDWMLAYVYVTDAPRFGKSDPTGTVTLGDLAAGSWELVAWHPFVKGGKDSPAQRVELAAGATATVGFTLAVEPPKRKRRGPRGGDETY